MTNKYKFHLVGLEKNVWAEAETQHEAQIIAWKQLTYSEKEAVELMRCVLSKRVPFDISQCEDALF